MAAVSLKKAISSIISQQNDESQIQESKSLAVLICISPKQDLPETPCLEAIYRQYFGYVCRLIRSFYVAREHVEDLAQDVFLIVARKLQNYRDQGAIKSWLYCITHHEVLHYRRNYARAKWREKQLARYADFMIAPTLGNPDQAVTCQQLRDFIQQFLASLDEEKRVVFVLHEIEGLTAPEIAESENINLNTVYSRIRVAKERWRRFLARVQSASQRMQKSY